MTDYEEHVYKAIGKRIAKQRKTLGLTQTELAEYMGKKNHTNISRWENGVALPSVSDFIHLSEILKTTSDYLLKGIVEEKELLTDNNYRYDDIINLPFYGDVSAGSFAHAYETMEWEKVSRTRLNHVTNINNCFVLQVNGDSMNKVLPSGSMIVIERLASSSYQWHPKDIVLVRHGSEYTLKRIRKTDKEIVLEPESFYDGFVTQRFSLEDVEDMELVGRVTLMYNYFV